MEVLDTLNEHPEEILINEQAPLKQRLRLEAAVLTRLCAPIIVIQLLQMAVFVTDTIMAGRYSAADLAGVAIGGAIWVPTFLFLMGTLSALTPTVAQLHGAKNYSPIKHYVYQGFWQALFMSVPIVFLAQGVEPLFRLFNVDDAILPIANQYLCTVVLGLPAVLAFNVLRFYSEGLSLTRPALYASLIGLLINVPFNYVLIFGKFGFPELGGAGCAWASAFSFWVMFIFMAIYVKFKQDYQPYQLYQKIIGIEKSRMAELFKVGLPIGGSHFVEASLFCVIAILLSSLGPVVVASHQIALNVSALMFMIPLSLSMGLTIRIGFLIGAGQSREARFTGFLGLAMSVAFALGSAMILFSFRYQIAALYNGSVEVIQLTGTLLVFAAVFQISDALQVTAAGALRGYKDTRMPMFIMLLSFWIISLPIGYTLSLTDFFGSPLYAEGFWFGLVLGLTITSILLIIRLQIISKRFMQAS
ncbi:Multidrug resistance protein MdtK [Thalassocella blandensis]|nr:Multidrug resistance protein MdtK [Thalassocella blandensis]